MHGQWQGFCSLALSPAWMGASHLEAMGPMFLDKADPSAPGIFITNVLLSVSRPSALLGTLSGQ